MKILTALFLAAGLLAHGGVFAAAPNGAGEETAKKTLAYDAEGGTKTRAQGTMIKPCSGAGDDCKPAEPVWGCGAFASHQKEFGFGFAATPGAAAGKALAACGQNECKVVSSGCQD